MLENINYSMVKGLKVYYFIHFHMMLVPNLSNVSQGHQHQYKWIKTFRDKNFRVGFYSKVGRDPVGIKALRLTYKSQLSSSDGIYDQH